MKPVKIAHISDLHCEAGDSTWVSNFNNLKNALIEQKIDIIINTGDCVTTPNEKNYELLAGNFNTLFNEIDTLKYIFTVPGNHDFWGNGLKAPESNNIINTIIPNWLSSYIQKKHQNSTKPLKIYEMFDEKLNFPIEKTIDENLIGCFEAFNIALYPLNSNSENSNTYLAQGEIKDPPLCLKNLESLYRERVKSFSPILKIAFFHHHPLVGGGDEISKLNNPYLILTNAKVVLESIADLNIDFALHGHIHNSDFSRYQPGVQECNQVIVSGCASSASSTEESREVKFFEVTSKPEVLLTSLTAKTKDGSFRKPAQSFTVLNYEDVRRNLSKISTWKNSEHFESLAKIKSKTKIVNINRDGGAKVHVYYNKILWNPLISSQERFIYETLRADKGRIGEVKYCFGSCPITTPSYLTSSRELEEDPLKPEKILLHIQPPYPHDERRSECLRIDYDNLNTYALNQREHQESYDWSKTSRSRTLEEYCVIEVGCQADFVDLVVCFPKSKTRGGNNLDSNYFPLIENIIVEPVIRNSYDSDTLNLLYGNYEVDNAEYEYIRNSGALKVWPTINQIAVTIRKPRPDLIYVLRWSLPEEVKDVTPKLTHLETEHLIKLEEVFLGNNTKKLQEFLDKFHEKIKTVKLMENAELVLFGNDKIAKTLKVVATSVKGIDAKILLPLAMGRGLAGQSFLKREVKIWQKNRSVSDVDVFSKQRIEKVVPFENDVSNAISFPLLFPFLFQTSYPHALELENYVHRAFGTLSIVFCNTPIELVNSKEAENFSKEESDTDKKDSDGQKKLGIVDMNDIEKLVNGMLMAVLEEFFGPEAIEK